MCIELNGCSELKSSLPKLTQSIIVFTLIPYVRILSKILKFLVYHLTKTINENYKNSVIRSCVDHEVHFLFLKLVTCD